MALAPDVTELEVGVVVARVLVVDDRHLPPVVDEIGGQQVVVARPGRLWPDIQGVPDATERAGMIEVARREAEATPPDAAEVIGLELEHVETVDEGLTTVELLAGRSHPRQHPGPLQMLVGQRLALEEPDDEDPVVGQEIDDGRTHPGGCGADAVLVLGPAVHRQLVGGRRVRLAEHVGPVGRRDLVVPVGQTAGQGLDRARPAPERLDPLE